MKGHRKSDVALVRGDSWVKKGLFALLLYFLLIEWIRPLTKMAHLTDLYVMKPLVLAIGCFLVLDMIRIPALIGWTMKILVSLAIVAHLFHQSSLIDSAWWIEYAQIAARDASLLLEGKIGELSGQSRTVLFLIGWALMISVVQSIIIMKRQALWFVVATVLYLIALQLWPGVDTGPALVRAFAVGLLFVALLHFSRIEQMIQGAGSVRRRGWPWGWLAASLILVASSAFAGLLLAKAEARAIKPVDWFESFPMLSAFSSYKPLPGYLRSPKDGGGMAKSGYGSDDSKLGGSLAQDHAVVFMAQTDRLTYWRGESKNIYTGKGWEQQKSDLLKQSAALPFPSLLFNMTDKPTIPIVQEILFNGAWGDKPLLSGGAITAFEAMLTEDTKAALDQKVFIDKVSGTAKLDPSAGELSYYKIKVETLEPDTERLSNDHDPDPMEIEAVNLQLPDRLPQRVNNLAAELTAGINNRYERVKAIESYLRSSFTYSLEKPVYPGEKEDFVDHFLFTQKVGYCDHFSTAMVVLLRSAGIPARWVKGFAPGESFASSNGSYAGATSPSVMSNHQKGEEAGNRDESKSSSFASRPQTVTVRNSDAHSWVEVYFPQTGWVPFEPTPGFSGSAGAGSQEGAEFPVGEAVRVLAPVTSDDESMVSEEGKRDKAGKAEKSGNALHLYQKIFSDFIGKLNGIIVLLSGGLILLVGLLLWGLRRELHLRLLMIGFYKARKNPDAIVRILDRLWIRLFSKFGGMRQQQTIREYIAALNLPDNSRRKALIEFTQLYETVRYDRLRRISISRQRIIGSWKKIFEDK